MTLSNQDGFSKIVDLDSNLSGVSFHESEEFQTNLNYQNYEMLEEDNNDYDKFVFIENDYETFQQDDYYSDHVNVLGGDNTYSSNYYNYSNYFDRNEQNIDPYFQDFENKKKTQTSSITSKMGFETLL